MPGRNRFFVPTLAIFCLTMVVSAAHANPPDAAGIGARLKAAYPEFVKGADAKTLEFKDGTRLPVDDGRSEKTFAAWLATPDIKDMFRYSYPRGDIAAPALNFDPGRARNEAFFTKIYGDCGKPGFATSLTSIAWLPKKRSGQRITVSNRNGVAAHLLAVSHELDALPQKFDVYLMPSAGGYVCRTIAGTSQRSGHGYGIAIDIATKHSDYWRWAKGRPSGHPVYRNAIPKEIVDIFEKHGFIWGGRWYHYDTMHFEYRPELLEAAD